MFRRLRVPLLAAAWGVATFAVLAVERLPGHYEGAMCGPWGCLPPLQALAAMHGFWLLMLAPPAALLVARARPAVIRAVGQAALAVGLLGLALVGGWGVLAWLETAGGFRHYAARRFVYVVVTSTDLPFGQLALAGAVCWAAGQRRSSRARRAGAAPAPDRRALQEVS